MFGTPVNRQFESPENKAKMPLTENRVEGIVENVEHRESTIDSDRILPGTRAELRDREVRTASLWPHNSALALGRFIARGAQEGKYCER